jgi:transposase
MIALGSQHNYYLYRPPADMRKGFDGLCGLVAQEMGRSPLDGSVYIFINRKRDRMKLLVWEASGFWLYYKRLEQGTFQLPAVDRDGHARTDWETLVLMLQGIGLEGLKRRKRYALQGA